MNDLLKKLKSSVVKTVNGYDVEIIDVTDGAFPIKGKVPAWSGDKFHSWTRSGHYTDNADRHVFDLDIQEVNGIVSSVETVVMHRYTYEAAAVFKITVVSTGKWPTNQDGSLDESSIAKAFIEKLRKL